MTDPTSDDSDLRLHDWPQPVLAVLKRLCEAGYDAYLVGGCVRDRLLGRPLHDYDVATSATPEQVQRVFAVTVATGLQHGTVTVLEFDIPVEVTTFRVDLGYSDGRHPDAVAFTRDLEADLARRDFTVNAIAVDSSGRVIDPFHGRDDARRGLIRAVGRASDRFAEDALRILRGLRLRAQLGYELEKRTRHAMVEASSGLARISTERIGQEFDRIAASEWHHVLPDLAEGPFVRNLPDPWQKLQAGFARLLALTWPAHVFARSMDAFIDNATFVAQLSSDNTQFEYADVDVAELGVRFSVSLWTIAAALPDDIVRALCKSAAWTRQRSRAITGAAQVAAADPAHWDTIAWRSACFEGDVTATLTACVCLDALDGAMPDGVQTRLNAMLHTAQKQPLWSLRQLAVTGADLTALGVQGPAVGQLLRHLVNEVLNGHLQNTTAVLHSYANDYICAHRRPKDRS